MPVRLGLQGLLQRWGLPEDSLSPRSRLRPIPLARLVVLLSLGVAACGSSETRSATPTTATSTTTTVDEVATAEETQSQGADGSGTAEDSSGATGESGAVFCAAAPESTDSVVALPPWSDGVERAIELQIGREDSRQQISTGLSRTPVQLTTEESADGGWSFLWAAEPTLVDDLAIPPQLLDQAAPLLAEVPQQLIRYRLSENRTWLGVDNPEEIRQAALDTVDILGNILPTEVPALEQTRQLFATMPDENLGQIFSEEPQLLHSLEGLELAVDEVLEFRDLLPNALGGEPFPATTTIEVVDLIDGDGCVAIRMRVVPDSEDFVPILMETLRQSFPATTTEEELGTALNSFEIENLIVGQYDYGSGFFRRITATQRFSDGTQERVDTKIITDVTGD